MVYKKIYAEDCTTGILKLSFSRSDIFINTNKSYLSTGEAVKLSNFHRTTSNKQPLAKKYLKSDGSVNKKKVNELLKKVRENYGTERPFSSHLLELNFLEPETYPAPNSLLNWHNLSSWSDLLTKYDYPAKEKYKHYPELFFEECLKLAELIFSDKSSFSKTDYDSLQIDDLSLLEKKEILSVMSKENLEFLNKRGRFPSAGTISSYFNGWNNAKKAAELNIARENLRWDATHENLIAGLFVMAEELKALPCLGDIRKNDKLPSLNTFGDIFQTKSWSVILFYLVKELKKIGRDDLIDYSRLGKVTKTTLLEILNKAGIE